MNLNAIRFEARTERGALFGIVRHAKASWLIAGWCCCDFWERWSKMEGRRLRHATESLRDQIRPHSQTNPVRHHLLVGSDNPPNAPRKSNYPRGAQELNCRIPPQSSASAKGPR